MHMRSAWFETLGCQMNEADSEKMAGILCAEGYRLAGSPEEADVILINTCSIRDKAEQKAFSLAGRFGQLKRRRPGTLLVLTGCVAQKLGAGVLERLPAIDAVVGTARMAVLPALLERVRATGRPEVDTDEISAGEHPAAPVRASRIKAWTNVMFGCDNHCAYCVVPLVRGRERSRRPTEVLAEVAALGRDGYREVTLLGQNVNSYGRGLAPAADFAGLLRAIDGTRRRPAGPVHHLAPEGLLHRPDARGARSALGVRGRPPAAAGRRRRRARADEPRLHAGALPPDHRRTARDRPGCRRDHRHHRRLSGGERRRIRRHDKALAEFRFDGIFSFRYSPREGTAACTMSDEVADDEKARRLIELQALQREITEARNAEQIGRTVEVLVEGPSRRDPGAWKGRTRANRIVNFPAAGAIVAGDFVQVHITGAGFLSLEGRVAAGDLVAARCG